MTPLEPMETSDLATRAALHVLAASRAALDSLSSTLDFPRIASWTQHICAHEGRVVLSGVGKSGIVGQKISATLASTGCPSFFLHPADALHGDLGMVTSKDTVLLLSNSGESEELLRLIPNLLRIGTKMGGITSRAQSAMAQACEWVFLYDLPEGEGCPLNFAPMASTTLQLAWGDILAAYRMAYTGFTLERFAANHPAGSIGSRLLKVKDLMHSDYPRVAPSDSILQTLQAMTAGRLGMALVFEGEQMAGIISDGDIRRGLERAQPRGLDPTRLTAEAFMTRTPVLVPPEMYAVEAAGILEARKITFLVVGQADRPLGVLHIHDLLGAKVL